MLLQEALVSIVFLPMIVPECGPAYGVLADGIISNAKSCAFSSNQDVDR
jgi:hypothetical protein